MSDVKVEICNNEEVEIKKQKDSQALSPKKIYEKSLKKKKRRKLLVVLLLLLEIVVCIPVIDYVNSNDLNYRVTRQLENIIFEKNQFLSGSFIGVTDFGYFDGEGEFIFKSGSKYNGYWKNNQMEGFGTLNVANHGTYYGEFSQSKKSGNGKFVWNNGSIYEGEWLNDQIYGQGTYINFNGVKYVGTFKENRFYEGTCEYEDDLGSYSIIYKNFLIDNITINFVDGTKYNGGAEGVSLCGHGSINFANGDSFEGEFKNGYRNGKGIYIWKNGDKYEGQWENDAMSGKGKYMFANGSIAEGDFKDNQLINGTYKLLNSNGEYTFKVNNQDCVYVDIILKNKTTYSGNMQNGTLTGTAIIIYSNGDKYSGNVINGTKSGKGVYNWKNGASYDGEWAEDKMNGNGTYFYPQNAKGFKLEGEFVKGRPNGECQYYVKSTEKYKTDWKNGKCVKIYE